MRKTIALFAACLSLASATALPTLVSAHGTAEEHAAETTAPTRETSAETMTTMSETPGTGPNATKRKAVATTETSGDDTSPESGKKARLEKYKTDRKLKLDEVTKKRISDRCTAAQTAISTVKSRHESAGNGRITAYGNVVTKLEALVASLKEKSVDTSELEGQITELKALIETFKANLTTYKTSVADTASSECKTDPVAFKAALDTSRLNQKTVVTSSQAVRAYIKETIKPGLQEIKKQLETKPASTTSSSGGSAANQ